MSDFEKLTVGDGVEIISVFADRFKTNELSLSFLVPLSAETAAVNAIVPMLLSRCSREYPTILNLNRRLASLYGAEIVPEITKVGEMQQLKIGMTCLDDRFSLDGEKITSDCIKLLLTLAFDPVLDENGLFVEENVEREKRVLTEKIESEENEKRLYVLRKAEEVMFEGEAYAVNRYGTMSDVAAITCKSAADAWKNILKTAKIVLTIVGSADAEEVKTLTQDMLSKIERAYCEPKKAVIKTDVDSVKDVTERINVKQGKLVMGFRVDSDPENIKQSVAMRSFTDIFGGGPYSKLFANVREKMSLCYYCSARFTKQKSFIMVQSGCEEENMDKARAEILNQLEEIKKGNFEYEFNSSKIALADALNSVYDAPESIEGWYTAQACGSNYITPSESAKFNNAVTKEDIIDCANRVKLDTVYRLAGEKEGE